MLGGGGQHTFLSLDHFVFGTTFCEGKHVFGPKLRHGYLIPPPPGCLFHFIRILSLTGLSCYKRGVMIHLNTTPIFRAKAKVTFFIKTLLNLRLYKKSSFY